MSTFQYTDFKKFNNSSALRGAWYDEETHRLIVEFLDSGNLAGYVNVARPTVEEFFASSSAGAFYARDIKHSYDGFSTSRDTEFVWRGSIAKTAPRNVSTFKIVASVTSEVSTTLEAEDFHKAMEQFTRYINEAMKGNNVEIQFKAVTQE